MLNPKSFIDLLDSCGLNFFTGVPDSLLKDVCAYISDNIPAENHIISANEGAALGIAAGYHLGKGKIPVVYMQNSGIGNAVNPLLSLTDKEVYNIPLLMLVGWRGEPGVKDEPQHVKQGKVTIPLFDAMGIKNAVIEPDDDSFARQLKQSIAHIEKTGEPYAFIIRKGTFASYTKKESTSPTLELTRERAIGIVASRLAETDVVVSTTGMISRELFEYRESKAQGHEKDFLTVGSMGHASQIALGIAITNPQRDIFCFDGDGATLMHMGSMAITGGVAPQNFYHIIFNNGAHDSVGGQPTVGFKIDIPQIALSCGYASAFSVEREADLVELLKTIKSRRKPLLLEVKTRKGSRKDLGRPTTTPVENKEALMSYLKK